MSKVMRTELGLQSRVVSVLFVLVFRPAISIAQPNVTRNSNLRYGTVVSGAGINQILLANSSEGKVTIGGTNSIVYVTLIMPATLTNGVNSVPYTWSAAYNNTANTPVGATSFSSTDESFILEKRQSSSYHAYIFIYGSIDLSSTVAAGNYSGNATVSVSYSPSGIPNNTATVAIRAKVIQGLSIQAAGSLSFETVVAGTTPTPINPQTSGTAASITATGNGGQPVTLTFPASSTLSSGPNTITFIPSLSGDATGNQSSSGTLTNGATITLSGTSGNTGNYYLWLGGSLGALPPSQAPGAYTGTFVILGTY